jgi:cyclic pyranopterin phosphate synthase
MPEGRIPKLRHEQILRYEEILRVVRAAVSLGVRKVRVTGGEPLVRKGIDHFLSRLHDLEGIQEVTLTTNGVALAAHLDRLWDAGVRRLNISLDTVRPERFRILSGADAYHRVWNAVRAAHERGFSPIKLNAVMIRGINDDELKALAALSLQWPFHVRFIECMPLGDRRLGDGVPLCTDEMIRRVGELGDLIPVASRPGDGPAQRFRLEGAPGEVGFISAMSRHFCDRCNRLRLTASGGLRPCLLSDRQVDVKADLRAGCSDRTLRERIREAVRMKGREHALVRGPGCRRVRTQMSSIGG